MKGIIKQVVERRLAKAGKIIISHTSVADISRFAELIYPVSTDKPLIRLGGPGDGGYLIPDDLSGIQACFSPGVDKVSEFELDCINRGIPVYLADQSVDAPGSDLPEGQFHFLKKFIGPTTNDGFITMEEWVNSARIDGEGDLLLQMDIEGAEYYTILNMPDALLRRFRIIVLELHWLDRLWEKTFHHLARTVMEKLTQSHSCVHNHPNNYYPDPHQFKGVKIPRLMELTFFRKDRIVEKQFANQFPHPLDGPNVEGADAVLPDFWYQK